MKRTTPTHGQSKLIPHRWAHFGARNYTYWRWLNREWRKRPYHGTLTERAGLKRS